MGKCKHGNLIADSDDCLCLPHLDSISDDQDDQDDQDDDDDDDDYYYSNWWTISLLCIVAMHQLGLSHVYVIL